MIALKNVLVATDFGEASETALRYGREFARTFGATLHVVHVADDVAARILAVGGIPEYMGNMGTVQIDVNATAEKEIAKALSAEDYQVLRAKTAVLVSQAPATAILDYARREGVDVIIAGTHGRGTMERWFMGSVADKLVRSAPCPVLTVRHPEHEFVLPDALQKVAR